jgi:biotin transport system substrate-specific component
VQNATAILSVPILSIESLSGKLVRIVAGTLFLAASSWISVPSFPVPITMQTYAVIVIGALLGARLGTATVIAWLMEAALGMPVLAHGAAGVAVFVGPTAGYLFSFPVAAAFVGWLADRKLDRGMVSCFLSMLGGNAINLTLGVLWLAVAVGWRSAFLVGFLPFWIGGIAKALLAMASVMLFRNSRSQLSNELR